MVSPLWFIVFLGRDDDCARIVFSRCSLPGVLRRDDNNNNILKKKGGVRRRRRRRRRGRKEEEKEEI